MRDERLVERCLAGDEQAWTDLWSRYGGLVKAVARRAGCTADEARDVLQLVAVTALEKLASLRQPAKLPGWLAGVARYRSLELLRRRMPGDEPGVCHATTGTAADEHLDRDQQLALLRAAFVRLDERCQRLIQALDLDEPPSSYIEAAAAEGLAPTSIGPIRRRCLNRLQKIFVEVSRSSPPRHFNGGEIR